MTGLFYFILWKVVFVLILIAVYKFILCLQKQTCEKLFLRIWMIHCGLNPISPRCRGCWHASRRSDPHREAGDPVRFAGKPRKNGGRSGRRIWFVTSVVETRYIVDWFVCVMFDRFEFVLFDVCFFCYKIKKNKNWSESKMFTPFFPAGRAPRASADSMDTALVERTRPYGSPEARRTARASGVSGGFPGQEVIKMATEQNMNKPGQHLKWFFLWQKEVGWISATRHVLLNMLYT